MLAKAVYYHRLLEESRLKEKLNMKRALSLCSTLLKQCRANISDKNLIDICQNLIMPSLQTDDRDMLVLSFESIGLLSLLDKGLFHNYSKIYLAIMMDCVSNFQSAASLDEKDLHETIIVLRSSFDGLIMHGVDEETQRLQDFILDNFLYCHCRPIRQISVEGICKLLFSIKVNEQGSAVLEEEQSTQIIAHLLIQLFDKRYLHGKSRQSINNQALNMFFRHYVLFS